MNTAELKKLAEAATPGPWVAGDDEDSNYLLVGPHDGDHIVYQPVVELHSETNAAYIAAANPSAILELLSELHRLSAELDEVRADRDSWAQQASDRAGEAVAAIEELEALKKAISEAEPVAHIRKNGFRFLGEIEPQDDSETPLYTLKGIK